MNLHPSVADTVAGLLEAHRPGYSLARAFYEDPAVYAADLDRVFLRTWHYAGHASQCATPGSFFLDEFAGDSIIVVRGRDERIRAFHNVCRHRGSRLATEASGCVRALTCPYHAWTFGLDGRLLSAPAMGDDFDPAGFGLKECAVRVIDGLILVCPGTPLDPLDDFARDLEPFIRPSRLEQTKVAATLRWPTKANWKLVMENFAECYHCGPAHPEYCSVMAHARKDTTGNPTLTEQYNRFEDEWTARMRAQGKITGGVNRLEDLGYQIVRFPVGEGRLSQTREGRAVAPLLGDYREYDGGVTGVGLRPSFNLYVDNDHAVILSFVPHGPLLTDTVITWLVRADAQEGRDYQVDDVTWLWRVTTDQDKRIVEDNQAGVSSRAYEPGPYSPKVEVGPPRFHRWYFRQLAEGVPAGA
ncbi:MAG: aromatic ring-hydroxylating dioxygenase subunit alpha [Opitutaceae bacterium]|nr:aromatic ring-hydroxylating dioxygenase subunit alpha [Opitutaceae bacterium]